MKKYFYSNGQGNEGPVTLDELKQIDIQPETWIWYEGLDDWKTAATIEELAEIFELSPPPIDSENDSLDIVDANDIESESTLSTTNNYTVKRQRMFSDPFSFDGRIRRTEYGISFIIFIIGVVLLNLVTKTISYPIYIALYWFIWAQGAKRCHDIGKNGWWQIIPFYALVLIFANADSGINQYGRNPKG